MKLLRSINKLICRICNFIILKYRRVITDDNLQIDGIVSIYGSNGTFRIGNNVRIISNKRTNPISQANRTILDAKERAYIVLGNNVGISNSVISAREKIEIEDDVMIGANCCIYDNDFHSLNYYRRISGNDDIKRSPVLIKKGAFIGANSIILKGVIIGKKSIIGAGSVVTKSVPDGEIWGGNPAKFIRKIEKSGE